jgi:tricorn protease
MTQPAISKDRIAFVYANDLWTADLNGKNLQRLTIDDGVESNPVFSPDGKYIAFSAQYDANTDVYIMPSEGGVPKRLTYHPGADRAVSFTPDGKKVLFISGRDDYSGRYTQFFTVPVEGGIEEKLKIPNAFNGAYSPDGKMITYNPLAPAFTQWKNYRGGLASVVWLIKLSDYSIEKIEQPKERCNDYNPRWFGDRIYFLSDRNGEFNLYSFETKRKEIKQLTKYKDFPILNFNGNDESLIYEQAGYLFVYNIKENKSKKLEININTDLPFVRSRYIKGTNYIRDAFPSPTGMRALFEMRGEIFSLPAEKGDARNLTNTTAVNERSPRWSPDGQNISYFSDETGEYQLYIKKADGKGDIKKYKLNGTGFYELPVWSPDNQKILFRDNSLTLYWLDLKSGDINKIASEIIYGVGNTITGSWSPDSKWIVYTTRTKAFIQTVYVYSLEQNKSFAITDGMSEVSEPEFDKSGKYIYFITSTDAGPVKQWFDMSNADMRLTNNIYVVTLRKDIPNPLAKESDEEKIIEKKEPAQKEDDKGAKKEEADKSKKDVIVTIDFENIGSRILALPIPSSVYSDITPVNEGEIYYIQTINNERKLKKYDLKKRKEEPVVDNLNFYIVTSDKSKILYSSGNSYFLTTLAGKVETGKGRLNIEQTDIFIEPQKEWKQIFNEAWRINKDYFYDPNMHGVDWKEMKEKYSQFLDYLTCRQDLNRVVQWMCSELSVGHHRVGGGDFFFETKNVPVGLLGADYSVENGRYRFVKIFGGLNWNPSLRAPLSEPGVDVKEGDYLIAVNGKEVVPPANLFGFFENTSGKIVELKVGPNPDGTGSKTVSVVPIANEFALRNRDWVEGNIKKVHEATDGKVAYVWVPNTSVQGHEYFKRYFFPQAGKDAIIVDERFNGGGAIADYYIDILKRQYICHWAMRYGEDFSTPGGSILGPKVLITDETAGSGGDLFPWMWRKFGIGPIVGKRTWGGLVGVLGFPVLMDGGFVTAPNLAIWTDEGWIVENEGVPADIEVDQVPSEVINGKDPQLEKAIKVALDELKKNPVKKYERPKYPNKVRK